MKTLRHLTLAFAFALLFVTNTIKAQWVSIPDTNFATFLDNNGFSTCLQGNNSIGWQMDTTCPLVLSCLGIDCNNKAISDLTGIQYFDSLTGLDCPNNNLASLPPLPPLLVILTCSDQVPGLSALPPTLRGLLCSGNALTSLPALPDSLTDLIISHNSISSLPPLPAGLQYIDFSDNLFSNFPLLPAGLQTLNCGGNLFTSLPTLPATLTNLNCERLNLTSLPVLPATLHTLNFPQNNITIMPPLPTQLQYLDYSYNNIPNPGLFPASLFSLGCNNTNLTTLAAFPDSLDLFFCIGNPITSLPAFPKTVSLINLQDCYNLSYIAALPDSVGDIHLDNNFALTCLPELKSIVSISFTNSGITCLPNYPTGNTFSNPSLSSVPLCNYFNNNGCPVYYNITGKAYEDANANCINDATESGLDAIKIQLWQNGTLLQQTIPAQGLYSFDVTNYGNYQVTIDTTNIPLRIKCPSSGSSTSVISAADSMDYSMDFALECKPGFDLEAKSIGTTGVFRPANFTTVEVAAGDASNFYGAHCATGVSGTVTLSFTGPAKFISAAPNALTPNVTGNTLTYNIANFGTVNFFEDFDIVVQTDTTAQANQQVCFTLNVTPSAGDNNPANNTFSICYTVVNSFDPNDKQVSPSGNIDTTQRDLVYTVRFQNTGNAEAQHIYITDTLSSHINPASFQLLAYSHAPMVQLDGNKLRFNFPNINLPDSTTNEPDSHGYVQFKVKLNNGLPVGTVINNTAFIYFDFNAPVITNTTTNTIYVPAPPAIKPVSIGKYRIDRAVKPNGRL